MRFVGLSLLLLIPALVQAELKTHKDWGNLEEVQQYDEFYFSAKPNEEALKTFKKNRGSVVIDLRMPQERDCSEGTAAIQNGLKYYSVGMSKDKPIDKDAIRQINEIISQNKGQSVLLFCETGTRAAQWFAIYLVQNQNVRASTAMTEAKKVGLKSEMSADKVKKYLDL